MCKFKYIGQYVELKICGNNNYTIHLVRSYSGNYFKYIRDVYLFVTVIKTNDIVHSLDEKALKRYMVQCCLSISPNALRAKEERYIILRNIHCVTKNHNCDHRFDAQLKINNELLFRDYLRNSNI